MHNALGVLDSAASDNGWAVSTETLPGGVGKVTYDKSSSHAELLWNIEGRYAESVILDGAPQHGSGALIALRRFLEGKDPDDGIVAIESGGHRAWYAGT